MELWYLISAYHLMMLYSCTKFQNKYLKGFQSYQEDAVCILKFSKEHNCVNSVDGVMALVLTILSDSVLYLYQVLSK